MGVAWDPNGKGSIMTSFESGKKMVWVAESKYTHNTTYVKYDNKPVALSSRRELKVSC